MSLLREQLQVMLELARLTMMSLAFVVALYAFFSKDSRLREGADRLLFVVFLVGISALLSAGSLLATLNGHPIYAIGCANAALLAFLSGWAILLWSFWEVYGRRFHMRERRFLKYLFPFRIVHSLLPKRYETRYDPRQAIEMRPYDLTTDEEQILLQGFTLFLIGTREVDLSMIASGLLVDGLRNGETGDYVCCQRPPDQIWDMIRSSAQGIDWDKQETSRPKFIDAYSPNLGFDDDILRLKIEDLRDKRGGDAVCIIPARTVAGIHTASNTAWYRTKKERAGRGPRKPHRMVYDRLSTLLPFSSVEQINNYFRHCIAAEKAYGMITVIVETTSAPVEITDAVYDMADCVMEFQTKDGRTEARMTKGRGLDITSRCNWTEYPI